MVGLGNPVPLPKSLYAAYWHVFMFLRVSFDLRRCVSEVIAILFLSDIHSGLQRYCKTMTVHSGGNLLTALAIGFGVIIAAGFECPVAKDPVSFIGDNANSVIFMWDCSLSPNESVLGVTWFKDKTTVALAMGSNFTPKGSYAGRVERNGPYGILLHNISLKDSGHYNISVILNSSLKENNDIVTPCQSAYLPALPAEVWKYNDTQQQLLPSDAASSLCDQEGVGKLGIGLICGLVPVAIIGLVFVSCFFYRKRHNEMQREDTSTSPEELHRFQSEGRDVALGQFN